ncbi:porin [Gemmatimonadota bacterium]
MFRRVLITAMVMFMIITTGSVVQAQVEGNGTLQGRAYFDISKGLSDDVNNMLTNGFRRVHFTWNMPMSEGITGRFRTDVKQNTDGTYRVFIKHVYADWKTSDMVSLRVGMMGTPMYGDIEEVWAYRGVEMTMQDYFKIRASADIGLMASFRLNDMIDLNVMFSNGEGYSNLDDTSFGKAYEVQGVFTPVDGLLVTAHYGLNGFDGDGDPLTEGDMENTTTMDFSVGYEGENYAIGGSYTRQSNYRFTLDQDGSGFWGFGRYTLQGSPLTLLGTWMNWDPDTSMDDDTLTLLMVGLDYSAGKGLSIIPNFHQTRTGTADPTTMFRITFNWKW